MRFQSSFLPFFLYSLKILLTTREDKKAKRPHQAFLHVKDSKSSLETSFALQVKENGKGKVELSQKDLPTQLLYSAGPLEASIIVASFGTSEAYKNKAFDLSINLDSNSALPSTEKPLRYGKLPEIHHIFKSDPTSPSKVITIIFTAAVVAALPVLFGTVSTHPMKAILSSSYLQWLFLGANLNHVTKAFGSSPIPHTLFFLSILSMEGVFFMYYTSWNLFQALPGAVGIGLVTFLSGSRALREVQQRRLAGFR
ncbi:hypothetical protein P7C71_g3301, partial [Lecanoromycetidae sp. Uapishka_2]